MKARISKMSCALGILIAAGIMSVGTDACAWKVYVTNDTKYRVDAFVTINQLVASSFHGHMVQDISPGATGAVDTGECPGAIGARVFVDLRDTKDTWTKILEWVCTLTGNNGLDFCTATCWDISASIIEGSPGNFRINKK
ncbi:MAG TPA: hypothetical protein P5244_16040 [Syntrophales bacterium]|nr:hypothetical protein [Syntrophales bacterium]